MTASSAAYLACVVHVPVFTIQGREQNKELWSAYDARIAEFQAFDPELVFVFGGDHYDNVFLNLIPQFMIGHRAHAIDDCGGTPGVLDVPTQISRPLANHLVEAGFDIATSYDMGMDHGFSNVLGNFLGQLDSRPVVPIYINAIADPRPTMRRCRELGEAIGAFAAGLGKRVAFLGSGGLSHETDFIFPQYDTASDDTMRDYIVSGGTAGTLSRQAFVDKIQTDMDGLSGQLISGEFKAPWINKDWDEKFLTTFGSADLSQFDSWTDRQILDEGGAGAGEIRNWVAAAAAAAVAGADERVIDYYSAESTTAVGVGVAHSR